MQVPAVCMAATLLQQTAPRCWRWTLALRRVATRATQVRLDNLLPLLGDLPESHETMFCLCMGACARLAATHECCQPRCIPFAVCHRCDRLLIFSVLQCCSHCNDLWLFGSPRLARETDRKQAIAPLLYEHSAVLCAQFTKNTGGDISAPSLLGILAGESLPAPAPRLFVCALHTLIICLVRLAHELCAQHGTL